MVYAGICETGLKREENQDAVFMDQKGSFGCFCVADGMGGHEHGERASGEIISCIRDWWANSLEPQSIEQFLDLTEQLSKAVRTANSNIRAFTPPGTVCGSTVVALLLWEQYYAVLHAGDSRAYSIDRKCRLCKLTIDDVWENQPDIRIKKRSLKKYSTYGKLLNAVGADDILKITVKTDQIGDGLGFLLCSDGLYKMAEEKKIARSLKKNHGKGPEAVVEGLRQLVYENGADDNVSIILIRTA